MAEVKHGMSRTKLYETWKAMRARCSNPKHISYKNYGGRGISVCDEWNSFELFYADMGDRPEGATLERVDNSKGYSKDNCVWSTWSDNNRNKRSTVMIEFRGESKSLVEWSEVTKISLQTLCSRLKRGWSVDRTLTEKPSIGKNQYTGADYALVS